MSGKLTVRREPTVLMELRRGTFQITLDGVTVGTIERRGTFETSIEPGPHRLQVRAGRYAGSPRTFEIVDGKSVAFTCSGARIWPVYLASFLVPNLALTLKRD